MNRSHLLLLLAALLLVATALGVLRPAVFRTQEPAPPPDAATTPREPHTAPRTRRAAPPDTALARERLDPVEAHGAATAPAKKTTPPAEPAAPPAAVLRGRVLDPAGRPVAGAQVRAVPAQDHAGPAALLLGLPPELAGPATRSGSDGRFELRLTRVEPGAFEVTARHADYARARSTVQVQGPGAVVEGILLTLPAGARIRGRVVGAPADAGPLVVTARPARRGAEGLPDLAELVEGITSLPLPGNHRATVTAKGRFEIRGLEPGQEYELVACRERKGMHEVCSERVRALAGSAGVTIRYRPGVTVTFRVRDAVSGRPLRRVTVFAGLRKNLGLGVFALPISERRRHDIVDAEGRVRLVVRPRRPEDLFDIEVEALGHETWRRGGIELPAAGATLDLGVVALRPTGVLTVSVHDPAGAPVAGARVVLRRPSEAVREASSSSGSVTVTTGGATIRTGGERRELRLGELPERTERVEGRTDDAGRCRLTTLAEARAVLEVRAEGFAPYRAEIAPRVREDATHEVVLSRGARVTVRVEDAQGRPAKRAVVEHRVAQGATDRRTTGDSGTVAFENLLPGRHRFRVRSGRAFSLEDLEVHVISSDVEGGTAGGGTGSPWTELVVGEGESRELVLRQPARGTLEGTVTVAGAPLEGARVRFLTGPAPSASDPAGRIAESVSIAFAIPGEGASGVVPGGARTDAAGRFRLENLPTGRHRLRITHPGRAMAETVEVRVGEGITRVTVALPDTVVEGRVTDEEGRPISGARLRAVFADRDEPPVRMQGPLAGIFAPGHDVHTDAEGRFTLRGLATGRPVRVVASAPGRVQARSDPFTLASGERHANLQLRLPRAGRVQVRIEGEAPAGAAVNALPAAAGGDAVPEVALVQDGRALLDGLAAGRWRIVVQAAERRLERVVDVRPGRTAQVVFTF